MRFARSAAVGATLGMALGNAALATPADSAAAPPPRAAAAAPTAPSVASTPAVAPPSDSQVAGLPEAPFGLEWLLSREQVGGLAADLGPVFASEFGDSLVATGLPKELADLHYSILSFGFDDRLIRVAAIGEGAEQDRNATRVTARYRELTELLRERYELVKSETRIDENYDGDRTALGFHSKKNAMYSEFAGEGVRVELSVFAEANRTHWRLIFEYVPAMRAIEERRKQIDEDAL